MVKSVLIITNSAPIGKNSPVEAIRLGSGFMGLGEDVACKIVFRGDATLSLSKKLDPTKLGMDTYAEHLEMAELSDLKLFAIEEDMRLLGLEVADLLDYELLKVIPSSEILQLMAQADATFRI